MMSHLKNTLFLLGLVLLAQIPAAPPAQASERMALVIGNSRYTELRPLANPAQDAAALAERLAALGFQLIGKDGEPIKGAVFDLREDDFHRTMKRFAETTKRAKPEIALLFYAGHGIQFGAKPYLLPVDVPKDDLELVERHAINLEATLRRLDDGAGLVIAVVDACREIPDLEASIQTATRSLGGSAQDFRGLARVQTEGRSRIVAYSAASGQLAADGDGAHSPYTEVLLKELETPNLEVGDLFRQVAYQFGQRYGSQQPELLIQGVPPARFYLHAPVAAVTPRTPPAPPPNAPAPESVGYLQVNTNVAAQVRLDGREVGGAGPNQPLNLSSLPLGEHQIEVSAPGYETKRARALVRADVWTQTVIALAPEQRVVAPTPTPQAPAPTPPSPVMAATNIAAVSDKIYEHNDLRSESVPRQRREDQPVSARAAAQFPVIDTSSLFQLMTDEPENLMLMDARSARSFAEGHLPMAISAPADDLQQLRPANSSDNKITFVVYCVDPKCWMSEKVALALSAAGYTNILRYQEGIVGWEKEGHVVVKGELSTEEMNAAVKQSNKAFALIDARSASEYETGHIRAAVSVPHDQAAEIFSGNPLRLKKSTPLIFYCHSRPCGMRVRSADAAWKAGYRDIRMYTDGISGWTSAGLALVTGRGKSAKGR